MTATVHKIVKDTHRPVVVDIYDAWKADIRKIDWGDDTRADKREPVEISETRKGWRR